MDKTKLVFCSSDKSGVNHEMVAYTNDGYEIFIDIYNPDNEFESQWMCLDVDTAIKFVKILKREIGYIKGMEVGNGR